MPIYEYRCEQCGHECEKMQRMSDAPAKDCPACKKPGLKRLVSASRFQLKGQGWYVTDFRDKPKAESKKTPTDKQSGAKTNDTATASTATAKSKDKKTTSSTPDKKSGSKTDT